MTARYTFLARSGVSITTRYISDMQRGANNHMVTLWLVASKLGLPVHHLIVSLTAVLALLLPPLLQHWNLSAEEVLHKIGNICRHLFY